MKRVPDHAFLTFLQLAAVVEGEYDLIFITIIIYLILKHIVVGQIEVLPSSSFVHTKTFLRP